MKLPRPNLKSILLYYSTFFSTILIIGGFYIARSTREIVSNLLFLPIVVFLWISFVQQLKGSRKTDETK
ncbi:MAG: hypothetical protein ACP5IC_01705 [Minisyncoccia bacterium]